jgi:hypothetical protein
VPSEEVLQSAAVRLVKAMAVYRVTPTVSAADRVIAARLAVKEAFIAAGWDPPPATLASMERDRLLLEQHAGGLDAPAAPEGPDVAERRRRGWHPAPVTVRLAFGCSHIRLAAT